METIEGLPTDRLFTVSPDAGHPKWLCSRCSERIPENKHPIRCFVDGGHGGEYRYHLRCLGFEDGGGDSGELEEASDDG